MYLSSSLPIPLSPLHLLLSSPLPLFLPLSFSLPRSLPSCPFLHSLWLSPLSFSLHLPVQEVCYKDRREDWDSLEKVRVPITLNLSQCLLELRDYQEVVALNTKLLKKHRGTFSHTLPFFFSVCLSLPLSLSLRIFPLPTSLSVFLSLLPGPVSSLSFFLLIHFPLTPFIHFYPTLSLFPTSLILMVEKQLPLLSRTQGILLYPKGSQSTAYRWDHVNYNQDTLF